jgi:SAM-dependent methyltransferase
VEGLEGDLSGTASSYGYQWQGFWSGAFDRGDVFGLQFSETADYFLKSLGLRREELQGKTVLDAGTGSGRVPMSIHDLGCTIDAVDMHSGISAVASLVADKPNVRVTQANLLALPFPDDCFDLAWSSGVLMYAPDASQVFRSIARTVRPGGRFFISVYGKDLNHYRMFRHFMPWAHKLPLPLLYGLSGLIALPLYAGFNSILWAIRSLTHGSAPPHRVGPFTVEDVSHKSYKSILLNLFDQLHPQFQSEHTVEEVLGWFESCDFGATVVTESIGMVAVRGIKRGA